MSHLDGFLAAKGQSSISKFITNRRRPTHDYIMHEAAKPDWSSLVADIARSKILADTANWKWYDLNHLPDSWVRHPICCESTRLPMIEAVTKDLVGRKEEIEDRVKQVTIQKHQESARIHQTKDERKRSLDSGEAADGKRGRGT